MTTLSKESISNLKTLLKLCGVSKIGKLKISKDIISGIDDEQTIALITSNQKTLIDIGANVLATTRPGGLLNYLNLMGDDCRVQYVADDKGYVSKLILAGQKTKSEFICSNPDTVKTPKGIPNFKAQWIVDIDLSTMKSLTQSASVISSSDVTFMVKQDKSCIAELRDEITRDVISIHLCEESDWVGDDPLDGKYPTYVESFKSKTLLPILKHEAATSSSVVLILDELGRLSTIVDGYEMTALQTTEQ